MLRLNHLDGLGVRFAEGFRVFFDPSVLSSMRQDRTGAAATIPAAVDQPVGSILNLGTLGGWWTAPSDTARPILRNAGSVWWLEGSTNRIIQNLTADLLTGVLGWTMFQALRFDVGGTTHRVQRVDGGGGAARAELLINASNQYRANVRRLDADTQRNAISTALTVGANVTLITRMDHGTVNLQNFVNGVLNGSGSGGNLTAGNSDTTGGAHFGMAAAGPTNGLQGRMYAWGLTETALSDTDIAALHTLLAGKMAP